MQPESRQLKTPLHTGWVHIVPPLLSSLFLLPMEAMAQTCGNYEKLRQPFFGDLHFHTTRSADASTLDTRNTPSDAFHFATGALVGLAPFVDTRTGDESPGSPAPPVSVSPHPYCFPGQQCQYTATRTLRLNGGRTLDFAATTDHSEYLGEDNICFWEGTGQCRSDRDCRQTGQICSKAQAPPSASASPKATPARNAFGHAQRSRDFERDSEPASSRATNDDVIDLPISYMEAPTGCGQGADCRSETKGKVYPLASPEQLLLELEAACTRSPEHLHCDFISITHNSDVSGGAMFLPPTDPLEAQLRADHEPLAEVFNIKGSSECRVYSGLVSDDPTCNFENYDFDKLNGRFIAQPTPADISTTNFVRSALESGLKYQQRFSVNPFQLGLVGSIDEHNGTPGGNDPEAYALIGAHGDASFANPGQVLNPAYFLGLESNPGGLTVAWAEENTRDSIFAALKRREVYATSGTRPIVRFFGAANLPGSLCSSSGTASSDFAAQGYSAGVPMGGSLAPPKEGAHIRGRRADGQRLYG
jgi:hypothetical protein